MNISQRGDSCEQSTTIENKDLTKINNVPNHKPFVRRLETCLNIYVVTATLIQQDTVKNIVSAVHQHIPLMPIHEDM